MHLARPLARPLATLLATLLALGAPVAARAQAGAAPQPMEFGSLLSRGYPGDVSGTAPARKPASPNTGLARERGTLEAQKAENRAGSEAAERKAAEGAATKGMGWMKTAMGVAKAGQDLLDSYKPLTPGDRRAHPDYNPGGAPKLPAHCSVPGGSAQVSTVAVGGAGADAGEGCRSCYEAAHRKLTAVRVAFEKLRRVNATTQAFTQKSLAFGDAASGVHGVAGIAWQAERRKIEQSLVHFNGQYDAKYDELLGLLQAALEAVSACEERHFKVSDWYDRFGFIYYSFMADRYRR